MTQSAPTQSAAAAQCWSCGAGISAQHFCPSCGKIQPLPAGADYFAFFGLPRRLALDLADLERRFHQLSWKLHPDNFVRATENERALSLERSSQLNDAYRTLRDPIARLEYVLEREGLRKEGQHKQQAPPELLEEVFELNESLDELRDARRSSSDGGALTALRARLESEQKSFQEKLDAVDGQLEDFFRRWDAAQDAGAANNGPGSVSPGRDLLEKMNELLNRRSYIRNLVANVQQELSE